MFLFKILFIVLISYVIGGYSTADILRLINGVCPNQLDNICICPSCGKQIPGENQIPIYSYIKNKGKCKNCDMPIPKISFILEIVIPFSIIIIAAINNFAASTFVFAFIFYQMLKAIIIIIFKKQNNSFCKRFIISLGYNSIIFISLFFIVNMIEWIGILFL